MSHLFLYMGLHIPEEGLMRLCECCFGFILTSQLRHLRLRLSPAFPPDRLLHLLQVPSLLTHHMSAERRNVQGAQISENFST